MSSDTALPQDQHKLGSSGLSASPGPSQVNAKVSFEKVIRYLYSKCHTHTAHNLNNACPICGFKWSHRNQFKSHVETSHPDAIFIMPGTSLEPRFTATVLKKVTIRLRQQPPISPSAVSKQGQQNLIESQLYGSTPPSAGANVSAQPVRVTVLPSTEACAEPSGGVISLQDGQIGSLSATKPPISPPAVELDQQNRVESQPYHSAAPSSDSEIVDYYNTQLVHAEHTATMDVQAEYARESEDLNVTNHLAMVLSTEEGAAELNDYSPQDGQIGPRSATQPPISPPVVELDQQNLVGPQPCRSGAPSPDSEIVDYYNTQRVHAEQTATIDVHAESAPESEDLYATNYFALLPAHPGVMHDPSNPGTLSSTPFRQPAVENYGAPVFDDSVVGSYELIRHSPLPDVDYNTLFPL